jgi:hypothetical protein
VAISVFSLTRQGQNHLFMFHSVRTTVERTAVAACPSSPGTGHAGHGWSRSLTMERGEVSAVAITHSCVLFSPFFLFPPQTLAAATGLSLFVAGPWV